MYVYPYNLRGLYHALNDTAEVWRLIGKLGCRKGNVPLLHLFVNECPCCDFAVTAATCVIAEEADLSSLDSRCCFCPMAGEWEVNVRLAYADTPCARGLFGEWCWHRPRSRKAKAVAGEISRRAAGVAEKVLRVIESLPEDESL